MIISPNFDIDKALKERSVVALAEWKAKAPSIIIRNIKETIAAGNSPVKGQGRYVEYSQSYKKRILSGKYAGKTIRPVNLYLSGKMMNSLIHRPLQTGFSIYFTSPLAKIHSVYGAGKSKVIRKIFPYETEEFKKSITLESDIIIRDSLKKEFSDIFN